MSVDVGCNNNGDHLPSYLGGAIGGLGHGVGDLGYGQGYGGDGVLNQHAGGLGLDGDHHVNGIGLSEGELSSQTDLLNGLGGVNGLLSEQGVANEHAAAAGIPFGAGMGGHDLDFGVHHGQGGGIMVLCHYYLCYLYMSLIWCHSRVIKK